jgi:hypothetical protein
MRGAVWEGLAANLEQAPGPAIHSDADANAVALGGSIDAGSASRPSEMMKRLAGQLWSVDSIGLSGVSFGRADLAGPERRTGDILVMHSTQWHRVSDNGCLRPNGCC